MRQDRRLGVAERSSEEEELVVIDININADSMPEDKVI